MEWRIEHRGNPSLGSVEVRGFEPLASSVRGKRSAGLSYTPSELTMVEALRGSDCAGVAWLSYTPKDRCIVYQPAPSVSAHPQLIGGR